MINNIRTDDSYLTGWYLEIDRPLLWCVLALVGVSIWAMISAGSVAAERIGQPWDYFILKMLPFYLIGLPVVFGFSMLNKKWVLGISVANIAICLLLLGITLIAPMHIKGSARFVNLGFANVMPSDLMKPGFIIITAWFLTKMREKFGGNIFKNPDAWKLAPMSWWTYLLILLPALLIILTHPDLGTFVLYLAVLSAMLLMAGLPWGWLGIMGAGGLAAFTFAFFTMSHVHSRIMNMITGTEGYQVKQSIQSIQHGGLWGSGDDAFVKQSLPDAHTDFVFSAISEDIGALMASGLLVLLFYVIVRLINNANRARDPFVFYATGGAAALFGTQVCINLMTALDLFAPKGMTLPFVSYGGSSFVGFCVLFGMIIAIIREDRWSK
jgi:cell division protein FtsW